MLSLYFLADQTHELREKKLVVERVPGAQGGGGATRFDPAEVCDDSTLEADGREDRILATAG